MKRLITLKTFRYYLAPFSK